MIGAMRHRLAWLGFVAILAACGGQSSDPGKGTLPGLRFTMPPGWTVYHTSEGIVRVRTSGGDADVDLIAHPSAKFDALVEQYSHVSLPSEITEDTTIEIDGTPARRISFAGKRPDTGVPTAGVRYLMRNRRHAYVFVYLASGPLIESTRKEAQGMIEAIKLDK